MEGVRVGAYLRVSSRSQSLATQREAIERAARARGDEIALWWSETASARTTDRPVLSQVRGAARRGDLERLYVFRLDRLTRSGIRDTLTLLDEFKHCGVAVCSVSDGFDPSGPGGDIVIAVLAWAAQLERAAIGERISAARARLANEGRGWGRPSKITEAQRAQIALRLAKDDSIRAIARDVGVPKSTVQRERDRLLLSKRKRRPKYLSKEPSGGKTHAKTGESD